jgi:hypothetical protein
MNWMLKHALRWVPAGAAHPLDLNSNWTSESPYIKSGEVVVRERRSMTQLRGGAKGDNPGTIQCKEAEK